MGSTGAKAIAEAMKAKKERIWKVFMVDVFWIINQSRNKVGSVKDGTCVCFLDVRKSVR